jgi:cell surface protein SprA
MAAILSVDSNLADFATISATGKALLVSVPWNRTKPKKREDIQQYNIVTNVNLNYYLKMGINFPFNYAIGEETITPEYDPLIKI